MTNGTDRDAWGSRLGLILAAAGNAIGIGNLLRFPGQAAANGGGAFMIPYVVCLLLFGLPMMWVAWSIGRHGGRYGHGSLPGMFQRIWPSPFAKYLGVLGLALPMIFVLYYAYIEAWCLGYAVFSFQGDYVSSPERSVAMGAYFNQFLGDSASEVYFPGRLKAAIGFMAVTLVLNLWVLSRGVAKGIEMLAKVAIPLLFLFCILLVVRVFTLEGEGSAWDGLNYLWSPDLSKLGEGSIWLAAAGQIFFTLSIGFGALESYASYVKENDDVALTGLTTASTNEFVEVIFGSMIAIPAIAVFYGVGHLEQNSYGTFSLGMIAMPEVLRTFPSPALFGGLWFLLLFFAAFTSSVGVAQPVMAFFQDELKSTRVRAALWVGSIWALGVVPVVLFYKYGVLNELDFWAGTAGLVLVTIVEAVLFGWVWGVDKGWAELHRGALMKVPGLFRIIIKYVTPVALIYILLNVTDVSSVPMLPEARYDIALANPHEVPGTIAPTVAAPEEGEPVWAAFEESVRARAGEEGDGRVWLHCSFGADGSVTVDDLKAEGSLHSHGRADRWTAYLRQRGYQYQEVGADGKKAPAAAKTVIVARVLNSPPYIWGSRAMILGFFILFTILIGVAFKGRPVEASA